MKAAPHEAGPEVRNNNSYKQVSIGLASPQYALAEPVNQPALALGNARVVWGNQIGEGIRNHVAARGGPADG